MYQDIIVTELEAVIKLLNQKEHTKLYYRIEPTKIVVDSYPNLTESDFNQDTQEPNKAEDILYSGHRHKRTKSLLSSINPNINMNLSENISQISNSKDLKINVKPLSNISESNLELPGENVNDLEDAINCKDLSLKPSNYSESIELTTIETAKNNVNNSTDDNLHKHEGE